MYKIEELFDKRSIIGTKLEQLLEEKSYTKAKLCEEAGVSRPTLDKLLAGTLTSKTNYEKHISKVLNCLSITPDILFGNAQNTYNRVRIIRNMMRITSEEISKITGIPLKRLRKIESGEDGTTAELRDIAYCLSTSVRSLLGTNFFETQVAAVPDFLQGCIEEFGDLNRFWGHIGILPANCDTYLWFPITQNTRNEIYRVMDEERIVVPCMNNKVLLLNMQNIKELVLLDNACDQPGFTNWDSSVDCGEIPLVVYDALDDYQACCYGTKISEDVLSPVFQSTLCSLCQYKGWSECEIDGLINSSTIYFSDGKSRHTDIDFEYEETITDEISSIYNFGEAGVTGNVLSYCDLSGAEIMLNMRNISLMELPLLKVENTICMKENDI